MAPDAHLLSCLDCDNALAVTDLTRVGEYVDGDRGCPCCDGDSIARVGWCSR